MRWDHPRKGNMRVSLPYAWVPRITEAIAVKYGAEITFADYMANNFGIAMVPDLQLLHQWRFRPVKCNFDQNTLLLAYRLWNEDTYQQVTLKNPKPGKYISQSDMRQLIKELLSSDPVIRSGAELKYREWY